jgi:hypothetical protein
MSWYSVIARDITKIHDSIDYFENELAQAKYECKITGNIEKASAAMPGIVEHRYSQLQEIEAILEYLNIEMRRLKSQHFRKYLEHYNRALSSRDCDRFIEGEIDVVDFEKMINEFSLLRNKWLGITKGLDQKSYALSNIIRLRVAGMEDATL